MTRRKGRPTAIPRERPRRRPPSPRPPATTRPALPDAPRRARRAVRPPPARPRRQQIGHPVDDGEQSLVDVLDSLLNQGVVVNADVVLALADVDLVYVRLSALLCAADRLFGEQK